ncbi:MAG TPA: GGDEF domain-containing protein [Candidatus Acidoferrales bacterium]|nr:GGDEF domain-containing protein [Candidatus Acidoferrales bacterium]
MGPRANHLRDRRTSTTPRRLAYLFVAGVAGIFILAAWSRHFHAGVDVWLYGEVEITTGFLAVTFAALALVRFRGTSDRLPLVLSCGFVIIGITLISSSFVTFHSPAPEFGAAPRDPMTWVIACTVVAVLMVAALFVERRLPMSRHPLGEIAAALCLVLLLTTALGSAHRWLPAGFVVHTDGLFPRPGNLFPVLLFSMATIGYYRRLDYAHSRFDHSLYLMTGLSAASCLAASQSERPLDGPFALGVGLQFASYAVLLAGALLDNVVLFEDVRRLAASDPLTGLANYRRLIDALTSEIERTKRTGRPFSLLLFDLDGLKRINDEYGHTVGSRAICRVAQAMQLNRRSIDTAARYGGDEFALILPETGKDAAREVARRISDAIAKEEELPRLTASAGVAVYPQEGDSVLAILASADHALYQAKGHTLRNLASA